MRPATNHFRRFLFLFAYHDGIPSGLAQTGKDDQLAMVERGLSTPESKNIYFDISWDETAKYLVGTPETVEATADLINRFPKRFLFGTDSVAPNPCSRG